MKVSAILKGKKDDYGRYPVAIRVNDGNNRSYKTLSRLRVLKSQFKNGKVVNHHNAKQFNEAILKAIHDAEAGMIQGDKKYPDSDLRKYMAKCLFQWTEEKEPKTLQKWRGDIEHFLQFLGEETRLSKVTVDHLNQYKAYLNKKYKASNTVWRHFRSLNTLFLKAAKEKVIENNPFDLFDKPVYKQTKRAYLTQAEVDRIEDYAFSPHCPPALKFYAVWFLIGCYTGLRFSDMSRFDKKEHLKNGRIVLHTLKTGEPVSLELKDKLKKFLEAVDYQPADRSNQRFNENLKHIMRACDIETNITLHVARHTFAVRAASAGISLEYTAKMLGQTDTKSTAIYYKITDKKLDQEFDKLF